MGRIVAQGEVRLQGQSRVPDEFSGRRSVLDRGPPAKSSKLLSIPLAVAGNKESNCFMNVVESNVHASPPALAEVPHAEKRLVRVGFVSR